MSEASIELEGSELAYPVLPTVGSQLRSAREAKGLSLVEMAQALKLGVRQVEALETGDWQALPGSTFIRGFVRNYARLVQVDATPLMEQLGNILDVKRPELSLPERPRPSMPQPAGRAQRRDYAMASVGLAFVVIALLVYFFLPNDLKQVRDGLTSLLASVSKSNSDAVLVKENAAIRAEPVLPPGVSISQVINPQSSQVLESASALSSPATALAPAAQSKVDNATPGEAGALRLSFAKEAWVEVRDRRGNVIFAQRSGPGVVKEIDGQSPFSLVIGYAPGVSLMYRGQNIDLAPHVRGDVARLTLE